jgi:hypothetical protein
MEHPAVILLICALLLILVRWFTEPDDRLSGFEQRLFLELHKVQIGALKVIGSWRRR